MSSWKWGWVSRDSRFPFSREWQYLSLNWQWYQTLS